MQEKLIIHLHAQNLNLLDCVISTDGTFNQLPNTNPEELAQLAADKEVIVIVPAEDVLLTTLNLPKLSRTRLAQALPYALEEQLIGDVETLHFAHAQQSGAGDLPVAIVSREKMQQWRAQLQTWNIKPDLFVPASLALAFDENTWHVYIHHMLLVRTGFYTGFAGDNHNFIELLDAALLSVSEAPQRIHIHNYTNEALAHQLTTSSEIKEDFISEDQLTSDLARSAITFPIINLLQGSFAVKKTHLPQTKKLWKVTSYLAAAWLGLLVIYPAISYFILAARASRIDNQIEQIYKRNFPQSASVIAPRQRMEQKLRHSSSQLSDNKLLTLMSAVGKGMQETNSVKLNRLDFQNNQLTLILSAGSSEDFAAFTDFLTGQGLNVKQQNANLAGSRVNATVVVS